MQHKDQAESLEQEVLKTWRWEIYCMAPFEALQGVFQEMAAQLGPPVSDVLWFWIGVFFRRRTLGKKTLWRTWPHLSCAMDCGPDGMCGSFALEYGWDFNFDRFPDPSHGTNCDFNGGLKAVGLMGLILCMMISWKIHMGQTEITRGCCSLMRFWRSFIKQGQPSQHHCS